MNLEDRLRSHLHSGVELIEESPASAGDVLAAGQRRTTRNRALVGVAAAISAFVIVGGALTLAGGGDGDIDDVATADIDAAATESATIETESVETESLDSDSIDSSAEDSFAGDGAGSDFFDGPLPAFDVIVGVDDAFAGLRNRDGVATALRSDDGVEFAEEPTTGIPVGATFPELVTDDGIFAAAFELFDGQDFQTWIGTSENLTDWTLIEVESSEGEQVQLIDIDIEDGRILAQAISFSESEEEGGGFGGQQLLIGPPGGPYDATGLPEGATAQVSASGNATLLVVDSATGRDVLRSTNGGVFEPVSGIAPGAMVAALNEIDGDLFATGFFGATFESTDQGATWNPVREIPEADALGNVSATVTSGGSTLAVLLDEFGPEGDINSQLYLRNAEGWSEFNISEVYEQQGFEPDDFVILVAVNDEELLFQLFPADGGEPGADPLYVSIPTG